MQRIALCGGTFDPFHLGHLRAPLSVRQQFGWDQIVYIPAWKQPFKLERATTSGSHRFAMAVLSTQMHEDLLVSPVELDRGGVSYSVETIEHFRASYPDAVLDWIIGDDNLAKLDEWRELERLLTLANFAVLRRDPSSSVSAALAGRLAPIATRPRAGAICMAENREYPVSSTVVRERLSKGEPVSELVHEDVVHYINKNGLYRTTGVAN